jgi:hypothetical protein
MLAASTRCLLQSSWQVIDRRLLSVLGSRPLAVRGRNSISSWTSGAKFSRSMIWETLARLTPPSRPMSA